MSSHVIGGEAAAGTASEQATGGPNRAGCTGDGEDLEAGQDPHGSAGGTRARGQASRPASLPLRAVPVRPRVPSHAARAAQPPYLQPEEMRAAQAAGASELTTEARLKAELLMAPSAAAVAVGAVQAAAAREGCQMKSTP